jgi:SAM-dependent methyltransferase
MANHTERDWLRWGDENPYFGVLTDPKFLSANLDGESREEFFRSGEVHLNHVYSVIHTRIRENFQARGVLDFGCGVGRLLVPFTRRAPVVVGVDVSPGMLQEAAKNCRERGDAGARLLRSDELDQLEADSFDLIHSYIVFQHIPVAEGERLLRNLIRLMAVGGVGVIHLVFSDARSALRRAVLAVRSRSKLMHGFFNLAQGKPFSWPLMQMNTYSMNRVFDLLVDSHCANLHAEFEDHGGFRGAILYFEKRNV